MNLSGLNFASLLDELQKKKFNGYLAICVKGISGLEEGTVLFDTGKFVGCHYEYLSFNRKYAGSDAFQRIINAVSAPQGVIDLVLLQQDQIHLTLAVNEDLVFVPPESDLKRIKPDKFSPFFEDQIKNKPKEEKQDLLKKFKLGGLKKMASNKSEALDKLEEDAG
ncbi:MAG: DUF2226 domain-containing protein [Candidatus Micrarchaeota archaeon]